MKKNVIFWTTFNIAEYHYINILKKNSKFVYDFFKMYNI